MVLNQLRFDNPFEFGHNFLPEFLRSEQGQFSVLYLKENIGRLFELPSIDPITHDLVFAMFNGTNIFIVCPIFVLFLVSLSKMIYAALRHRSVHERQDYALIMMSIGLILLHVLLLCAHRTMGGAHFGNRYIVDILPVLYLLWLKVIGIHSAKTILKPQRIRSLEYILFALCYISGFFINFIGVLRFYNQ